MRILNQLLWVAMVAALAVVSWLLLPLTLPASIMLFGRGWCRWVAARLERRRLHGWAW